MHPIGDSIGEPALDFEAWRVLIQSFCGRYNPEGIEPNRRLYDVSGMALLSRFRVSRLAWSPLRGGRPVGSGPVGVGKVWFFGTYASVRLYRYF
jgi:hypothetical protein